MSADRAPATPAPIGAPPEESNEAIHDGKPEPTNSKDMETTDEFSSNV
ncbi:uncharacterized protein DNG_02689 [Cephalotrichum gorgonifer]|uniref:Uncharacterized protein n=1 Tax=Cephalotrichum gorgonifer TaxID=2041049 RepID=A0AAE8MV11_9PEZI|nr:uncharacterized protein DNG_02689 [Cephalotrichum gorgonifer]